MLFARALLAFLMLPGIVAFAVPWLLVGGGAAAPEPNWLGLVPLTLGLILLLSCVGAFYVRGRGTLAPWDPPKALVVSGIYRFSRNPMYVAVVLILWGWAVLFRAWPLAVYAASMMLVFHLRVVWGEEPWLARTHGDRWLEYKVQVPRWMGIPRATRQQRSF